MSVRYQARLVDQVLGEVMENVVDEIVKDVIEKQEDRIDKEEQIKPARSSARIASQKAVDYEESRRTCSWNYSEIQALAAMLVQNGLRVGKFGPATVEHLVEMGKVWFFHHFLIHIFLN